MASTIESPIQFKCAQSERLMEALSLIDDDNPEHIKLRFDIFEQLYSNYQEIKKYEGNQQCMIIKEKIEKIIQ